MTREEKYQELIGQLADLILEEAREKGCDAITLARVTGDDLELMIREELADG